MNWWLFIIIPLTSAFIGWFSIWIAIKVLIVNIPKRQQQIAEQLGMLVSTELFSFDEIEEKITNPDTFKKIMPVVEKHVDEFLHHKLKEAFPMISMFIGEKTINSLKTVFMNELETIFPVIMKNYVQNLQQEINIEQLVTSKIASFPSEKLQAALSQNLSNELRLAKLMGGAIGLVVGLAQVGLVYYLTVVR